MIFALKDIEQRIERQALHLKAMMKPNSIQAI